jgi:selenocysteine lyase/cysteine desulfurase
MSPERHLPVLDIDFLRSQFPFFETEMSKQWAFFDNAGGTFACGAVVDRLTRFYRENKVQPYTHNAVAAAASEQMAAGRSAIAALLGVPETTLTLGPSTTQNFNTLSIACAAFLEPGDEILVCEQDHEANIGGWERTARLTGAVLRVWPVDPETGELELATLEECLNAKTRIVSVTHSSNIIGTVNPINDIVRAGHRVGAKVVIDGVSYAAHTWPDVLSTGADAYAFSTYKTFATHLGVLYVAPDFLAQLTPQCHFFNAGNPWACLDAAGPDHAAIAALAGLGELFETLHEHHFEAGVEVRAEAPALALQEKATAVSRLMNQHEGALCALLLDALDRLPVRIIGKPTMDGREANVAFVPDAYPAQALGTMLAEKGIAATGRHFYAFRLIEKLGIDTDDGVLRISFAAYNTKEETLRLIAALESILGG